MPAPIRARLTYANVMSTIAVFVALGGSSYAAVQLSRDGVKARHIAANAVRSVEVKDRSLRARDFARGQLPRGATGPQGPQGFQGPQGLKGDQGDRGPAGGASREVLFAEVDEDGNVDNSSGGVTATDLDFGTYEVDFGRPVANCTAVGTIGSSGTTATVDGQINVADRSNPEGVFVETNNTMGRPFRLVVVC
jgi:hypothetical protein